MAGDKEKDRQGLNEDEKLAAEWESAMTESGDAEEAGDKESPADDAAAAMADNNVRTAPMEEFDQNGGPASGVSPDLDVILDIPVVISMEVGNTQIPIRNLLQLNQGSVIELDRLAGEPLNVLVNGTLIAHGEVVMVNDKFGIRLTDVISPAERIKRLQR